MKIQNDLSDMTVLEELGHRLSKQRLDLGLTQAGLAISAGLGKRTIERLEAGKSVQLDTLVRILRVLNVLDRMDSLIPDESAPRPMELLKLKGKERQRASTNPKSAKESKKPLKPWVWGDGE
ncbi:helix-turn-helix domain-containing protein [Pelotalea chapellei]|uniref:Helix-turn-helix domain-containing protein n=1 Tax=Pelotalea chapellei TaxID=44671 RepID=A0ABS5U5P2_9BACT|nr:helix-turn-helix domain-containing protein [Pelotalea chapellei]MBT1070979.1 helix-turn-helix domain-containing protein [Pelotalea chapellei]